MIIYVHIHKKYGIQKICIMYENIYMYRELMGYYDYKGYVLPNCTHLHSQLASGPCPRNGAWNSKCQTGSRRDS